MVLTLAKKKTPPPPSDSTDVTAHDPDPQLGLAIFRTGKTLDVVNTAVIGLIILAIFVVLGLTINSIAGTTTALDFNVNISIAIGITFAASTTVLAVSRQRNRKRADRAEGENARLREDRRAAIDQAAEAERTLEGLRSDNEDLRSDNEALRRDRDRRLER